LPSLTAMQWKLISAATCRHWRLMVTQIQGSDGGCTKLISQEWPAWPGSTFVILPLVFLQRGHSALVETLWPASDLLWSKRQLTDLFSWLSCYKQWRWLSKLTQTEMFTVVCFCYTWAVVLWVEAISPSTEVYWDAAGMQGAFFFCTLRASTCNTELQWFVCNFECCSVCVVCFHPAVFEFISLCAARLFCIWVYKQWGTRVCPARPREHACWDAAKRRSFGLCRIVYPNSCSNVAEEEEVPMNQFCILRVSLF